MAPSLPPPPSPSSPSPSSPSTPLPSPSPSSPSRPSPPSLLSPSWFLSLLSLLLHYLHLFLGFLAAGHVLKLIDRSQVLRSLLLPLVGFLEFLGFSAAPSPPASAVGGGGGGVQGRAGEREREKEREKVETEWSAVQTEAAALLPPRGKDHHKLTVVLDLDETLVCAYPSAGLPAAVRAGGLRGFTLHWAAADAASSPSPRVSSVTVFERPGLAEFLARTSQFAEIVLFTAGVEGYARPLVDHIDPHRRITHRLYRSSTVSTKLREHVKDLSALGRDLRRVVIVDNNPFSFLLQPLNGVPCVPFTGHQIQDQQLLQVLLPLLEQLAAQPDVRPFLLRRFHMPTWFQSRGVPAPDQP